MTKETSATSRGLFLFTMRPVYNSILTDKTFRYQALG